LDHLNEQISSGKKEYFFEEGLNLAEARRVFNE
jgi:hypothetical protein